MNLPSIIIFLYELSCSRPAKISTCLKNCTIFLMKEINHISGFWFILIMKGCFINLGLISSMVNFNTYLIYANNLNVKSVVRRKHRSCDFSKQNIYICTIVLTEKSHEESKQFPWLKTIETYGQFSFFKFISIPKLSEQGKNFQLNFFLYFIFVCPVQNKCP